MTPPEMAGWNLGLRFGLEIAALAGLGIAAWRLADGIWRWVAVLGVPLAAAAFWATFNVPGDPSRSGKAPIVVPGVLRLTLELAVLGGGATALLLRGPRTAGIAMVALVVIHYAMSTSRVEWLLSR